MTILIIPDVHLKPWMFNRASELIEAQKIDRTVCLMDIADDWGQQFNLDLYIKTYDAAIKFAATYSNTLWCYGNHDICYLWNQRESGFSPIMVSTVCEKLRQLRELLPDENQLAFVHRIDNYIFSHAGVTDDFVRHYVPACQYNDVDAVIETINKFGPEIMWTDDSPIWVRLQHTNRRMYKPRKLTQVVGHTPTSDILVRKNLISCDVFSTYSDGNPIGSCEFLVLDTEKPNQG